MPNRYNELEYAEELLQHGFLSKYHVYELKILAKYFKHKGIKPKERKEKIYEFCNKFIEGFDRVLYFKTINSVVNYSKKKNSKLIIVDSVSVYQHELDFLDTLDIDYNYKKVLFTIIVFKKIQRKINKIINDSDKTSHYLNGSNKLYKEIKEAAKIPNTYKMNNVINDLAGLGLVDIKERGLLHLNFFEELGKIYNSIFIISVNTFDNIGYFLDKHLNDSKIVGCSKCGELMRIKSLKKMYCDKCWNKHRNDYKTKKEKEYRDRKRGHIIVDEKPL